MVCVCVFVHACVSVHVCARLTQAFLIRQFWQQQEVGCGFGAVSQEVADCITAAQMEVGDREGGGQSGCKRWIMGTKGRERLGQLRRRS